MYFQPIQHFYHLRSVMDVGLYRYKYRTGFIYLISSMFMNTTVLTRMMKVMTMKIIYYPIYSIIVPTKHTRVSRKPTTSSSRSRPPIFSKPLTMYHNGHPVPYPYNVTYNNNNNNALNQSLSRIYCRMLQITFITNSEVLIRKSTIFIYKILFLYGI